MIDALLEYYYRLISFMDTGGPVLWMIAGLTFVMWLLIIERIWFFRTELPHEVDLALGSWQRRKDHLSWRAGGIRRLLLSRVSLSIRRNLALIKTLVTLCPLLGLLGTVTGMLQVFDVLSVSGDEKAMAGGVSQATISTMAGMVAALSGLFAYSWLERIALREVQLLRDHLTRDLHLPEGTDA